MIDPIEFAKGMLISFDESSLNYALERERESLWPLWAEIEEQDLVAGQPTLQLSNTTVEVILVSFNRKLLTRGFESVLNAVNKNWQTAANAEPQNWLYKGEQPLQQLRLYPPPSVDGKVQVVKHVVLPANTARIHDVILGLSIVNRLTISDPLRARIPEAGFSQELIKLVLEPLGISK